MAKLLLLSLLIATLAIPMIASKDRSFTRGLAKTWRWHAIFIALYVFALLYVYPHIL